MNKWEKAKKEYQEIKVPEEYSYFVTHALKQETKKKNPLKIITIGFTTAFALFVVFLNMNSVLAENLSKIPVVGNITKFFTFQEYKEENVKTEIHVTIPKVELNGNNGLEKRINAEILKKMNDIVDVVKKEANDYYESYLQVKDDDFPYYPTYLDLTYDLKYNKNNVLSFSINKLEIIINSYQENFYYNINLETGESFTLEELLGKNYIEKCNQFVKEEIKKRSQNDHYTFFDGDLGFQSIDEKQDFYINSNGKVVLSFPKYSIAPGYMGIQEFELPFDTILTQK